jgi:pimeloyl-ACP methyl ester carboxylesterase
MQRRTFSVPGSGSGSGSSRRWAVLATLTSGAVAATVAASGTGAIAATPGTADAARTQTVTAAAEARRVDQVPTPKPDWFDCTSLAAGADCATVPLPLDYTRPKGAKTDVAVLRIKAKDQAHRIGSLFLNPGGPGGSGTNMAAYAQYFLSPEVLARFDIIGFDPRGTNFSDNVRCFHDLGDQTHALAGMNIAFPWTKPETSAYVKSAQSLGKACSTTGRPLAASMSTAEVARDMDVLRRAVGDKKLSYLGFSYGTYLGETYANMFPDRVRAVAIDGVLDPIGWAGTPATAGTPQSTRIRSGQGAVRALEEILRRCAKTGKAYCSFAGLGDPEVNYHRVITALKKKPLTVTDPDTGETFQITYANTVAILLNGLYYPDGASYVDDYLTGVLKLIDQPPAAKTAGTARPPAAPASLVKLRRAERARLAAASAARAKAEKLGLAKGYAFPYYNNAEAFSAVLCSDGLNPADAAKWAGYADADDRRAPEFGRLWTWASAQCASSTWTAQDPNAYRGPFTHRTANPVLVVGNYYDPATNYDSAVATAALMPNSRLLSSDSWGHTAYGTSTCTTKAVDGYLLTLALPAKGTVCTGAVQPFTTPLPTPGAPSGQSLPGGRSPQLPPVTPPLPLPLP